MDKSVSRKYVNDDPDRYCLASRRVPLKPGGKYRLSGWVKSEKISGADSGATFCIEWTDKDGKWLGGAYPQGAKHARGGTQITSVARVPEEAGSCTVSCFVRKGMTGTAHTFAWQFREKRSVLACMHQCKTPDRVLAIACRR